MKRAPSMKALRAAFPSLTDDDFKVVRAAIHADKKMTAVDLALKNHGVEYVYDRDGRAVAAYSNSGETYAPTILRDRDTGNYRLTTVGDFVECYERRHGALP